MTNKGASLNGLGRSSKRGLLPRWRAPTPNLQKKILHVKCMPIVWYVYVMNMMSEYDHKHTMKRNTIRHGKSQTKCSNQDKTWTIWRTMQLTYNATITPFHSII